MGSGNDFEIALESSLTHASIAMSFGRLGLDASPASKQACNLGQSVFLKSGRFGGLRKHDRYRISISVGKLSELRYSVENRSLVKAMFRTSRVAEEL